MVKHPRSFRRLLLLRILLLSTPILLLGQGLTLRKARTSLLETARQNLASSAIRKADELEQGVKVVQSDVLLLSQSRTLPLDSAQEARQTLLTFVAALPYDVRCIELYPESSSPSLPSATNPISTCNTPLLPDSAKLSWRQAASEKPSFALLSLTTAMSAAEDTPAEAEGVSLIDLLVAAPVYDSTGKLRYTLTLKARLSQLEDANPRSLVGKTVVIDANGLIVVHPDRAQVGRSIASTPAAGRLQSIVGSIRAGNEATLHLFDFVSAGDEWLAGYSGSEIAIAPEQTSTWNVLAVTPLNQALHALKDIRQIFILLTLGLLGTNALLALYVAREFSLPIERLIHYAQEVQDFSELKSAPRNRSIWELDYLGQVLERMLRRLQAGSAEIRQAWQDAQLANQLKNEFLANTSHELRTPLNAIIGCIRLVRDDCCDNRAEEMEFLERADNAAIHLLKIIDDILDIAKIEAGTMNLTLEPVDLSLIIQEVLDLQTLQIQQKGLYLKRPTLPATPLMVQVDASKLKQVLLNVIYNAIKFTHEGGLTVEVTRQDQVLELAPDRATASSAPIPCVQVMIRDSGIGIDPKEQHKLFRPFAMVDGSHTRRYEGTGLGLAISRNFMKLMGGTIILFSEGLGHGTTVTITLPLLTLALNPTPETEENLASALST